LSFRLLGGMSSISNACLTWSSYSVPRTQGHVYSVLCLQSTEISQHLAFLPSFCCRFPSTFVVVAPPPILQMTSTLEPSSYTQRNTYQLTNFLSNPRFSITSSTSNNIHPNTLLSRFRIITWF
jgi:hypothetical protein